MKQEKNNILQSAKVILLGLIIAVGVSYVSAFVGPTADAPGNNVKAPLNSSETNQAKDIGSCTTGSCGGIAVGTFNAYRDSSFQVQTYILVYLTLLLMLDLISFSKNIVLKAVRPQILFAYSVLLVKL